MKYILTLLLLLSYTQASSKDKTEFNLKNILQSLPKNNTKTTLHNKNYYDLKKGLNHLSTSKDGVDIEKTFFGVESVFVYDKTSSKWAGYSSKKELMVKMNSAKILKLKYIEPKIGFFVLCNKAMRVPIFSKIPNAQCQKIIQDKNYESISASGIDKTPHHNSSKSISLISRNFSHTRKGVYNDSRILIIVPKLKKPSSNKKLRRYGPAVPKMLIEFNEVFQDKLFYAYDYLNESCYKGYFPSQKRPPAPTLKKLR